MPFLIEPKKYEIPQEKSNKDMYGCYMEDYKGLYREKIFKGQYMKEKTI